MLDEIKASIRHEAMCSSHYSTSEGLVIEGKRNPCPGECNCSRREKIAFLERLGNPTEAVLIAGEGAFREAECQDDRKGYRHFLRCALAAMLVEASNGKVGVVSTCGAAQETSHDD